MPSTRVPTTITTGGGPPPPVGVAESLAAALTAHITDPVGAHPATAISYAGGPNWHDGTTNPASDVEVQLDKIVSDLSDDGGGGVVGSDLIGTDASPNWHNSTWMTASSLKDRTDLIVSLLASDTGVGGSELIGSTQIANTTVTIPAGSIDDHLRAVSLAANIQYAGGPNWAGGTGAVTNPATSLEAQVDKIITDLAKIGGTDAGVFRIGTDGVTTGPVTLPAGNLEQRLVDLQDGKIRAYARSSWLGGRTNPDTAVPTAIDKIIVDLGAQTSGDDGAERIGAYSNAGNIPLTTGSVRSQLNLLSNNGGNLGGNNLWTGLNYFDNDEEHYAILKVIGGGSMLLDDSAEILWGSSASPVWSQNNPAAPGVGADSFFRAQAGSGSGNAGGGFTFKAREGGVAADDYGLHEFAYGLSNNARRRWVFGNRHAITTSFTTKYTLDLSMSTSSFVLEITLIQRETAPSSDTYAAMRRVWVHNTSGTVTFGPTVIAGWSGPTGWILGTLGSTIGINLIAGTGTLQIQTRQTGGTTAGYEVLLVEWRGGITTV